MRRIKKKFKKFYDSLFNKPDQTSWQSYYKKEDKKRDYKHLKKAGIAVLVLAIVYVAQVSNTKIGQEAVNLVQRVLTTQTDIAYVLDKGSEYSKQLFPNGISLKDTALFNSIKAVVSKPADPLMYMVKPVEGELVLKYGSYTNPETQEELFNEGISILTKSNSNIAATAKGKIESIIEKPDSGYTVIVDHGKNTRTVYSQLGEVFVKKDDTVNQGQIIGKVGVFKTNNKDLENKPILYFEVREGAGAVDPLNRIKEDFKNSATK
ncbi:M23 family metallopeptidase [Selenomonadales bacterium OttesenSCG-928-I06]|nr:M23 family metallopeptidase [Selenomonadales bacterium OttesenSCG-928-I06]